MDKKKGQVDTLYIVYLSVLKLSSFYPIKTFLPSKANPYFRIFSLEKPLAIKFSSYFFSSIWRSAHSSISSIVFSFRGLNTLNYIIIASSLFISTGSNVISYLPNPLSRLEVTINRPLNSTSSPSTNP